MKSRRPAFEHRGTDGPCQSIKEPWIYCFSPDQDLESTDRSGKWCILCDPDEVDAAWLRVADLVHRGALIAAKASTRLMVAAGGYTQHVICAYTIDWEDRTDVQRVRELLRKAGFRQRLGYKRDADTFAGIDTMVYYD